MSKPTLWAGGRYESLAEYIAGIADQTVAAADRRHSLAAAKVVDLACGTGSAALAAASRGAHVTGVDVTPELIAIGEQKATAAGQSVTWVTADAADTGLPDGVFDVVVSNMGTIFVEPDRQVAELGRLLRPAGVLAYSSWVRSTSNPLFDPIVAVLGAPPSRGFTPDQWGDPATIASRLAADFADVTVEEGMLTWSFESLAATLRFLTDESPMHVDTFARVTGHQRDRLVTAFEAALRPHADGDGVHFDSPYVVVSALRR